MKEGVKSMLGLRSMRGEIPLQEVCVCLWLQEVCGTVPLCLCDELSRSPSCNAFETSPIPIVIVVVANFIINVVSTCILYTSLLCLGCLERHPFAWKWFQFVEIIFVLKFKGRSYPVMCATVKRCVFFHRAHKTCFNSWTKTGVTHYCSSLDCFHFSHENDSGCSKPVMNKKYVQ